MNEFRKVKVDLGEKSYHVHIGENIVDFLDSTDRKAPLLIYCYHGVNSKDAAEYFVYNGFQSVFSLNGGYSEFSQENPR